jgi:AAA ATPase domain
MRTDSTVNFQEQSFDGSVPSTINCLHDPIGENLSIASTFILDPVIPLLSDLICKNVYGREKEQSLLEGIYKSVCMGSSQAVFLAGESGVGKTALVETLRDHVSGCDGKGYFVSGKYDQIGFLEPFSALFAAFSDAVTLIQQSGEYEKSEDFKIYCWAKIYQF